MAHPARPITDGCGASAGRQARSREREKAGLSNPARPAVM